MTTCPRIYTVRVHPVSKMVRVMPTETETTKDQTASPIIAPRQEAIVLTACMRSKDVRESGSIEQDADTVLFLSSDPDEIKDEKSGSRQVILSIAKNRSGPTGDIDMLFVPTSTKFYEVGPRKENRDD